MTTIGDRVRAAMALRRKTQGDLAARLGISQQAFSQKLTGRSEFRVSELIALADTLGVAPEWLTFGVGELAPAVTA